MAVHEEAFCDRGWSVRIHWPAEISGTITAEDVQAIADQGVEAGSLEDLLRSIRARATYVNVSTGLYPDGEIRGQIRRARRVRRDAADGDGVTDIAGE